MIARNSLSRPPHRKRSERGRAPGSEGGCSAFAGIQYANEHLTLRIFIGSTLILTANVLVVFRQNQPPHGDPAPMAKGGTPSVNYIALAKTVAAALEKAGLGTKSRNFPPGTKREASGECLVGPATSLIDLPFLDACFAAGLLDVFDAISVHPYRQGGPESIANLTRFFSPS